MKTKRGYDRFANLTRDLLRVSHDDVKSKLEAEKRTKKRKKSRKSSASRVAGAKG